MLWNNMQGNDFIVFEFMKVSIFFLTDGKNLVDSIDQSMQWLSVLWTFFCIGPAKELGQYPALMTSSISTKHRVHDILYILWQTLCVHCQ